MGGSIVDDQLQSRPRRIVAEVESFLLAPAIVARTRLILTAPKSVLLTFHGNPSLKVVAAPFELPALNIAAYWDPSRNDDARVRWVLRDVRDSLGPTFY